MATYLGTGAVFQAMHGATAGNLGGGGFNPANANFPTDGVIAGGTGSTPTITPTSSYAFTSLDATNGAWVFFPAQSGVTYPTWAQITGVAGGVATLAAGIGQCVQIISNRYVTNTTAGIASSGTPTLTYGVDYSQQTVAQYTATTATGTTTAWTDATNVPGSNWIGNFLSLATGTGLTAGWFECTNVSVGTVTLDRTAGTSYTAVTYYLGGAVSLGGSTTGITDSIFFALGSNATTAGCRFFIQGGTNISYSIASGGITTLAGNADWPSIFEGYAVIRGDRPQGATRPTLAMGANACSVGVQSWIYSLQFTGNTTTLLNPGANTLLTYVKATNTSTTANHYGLDVSGANAVAVACEFVSYNGYALSGNHCLRAYGCYIHDSSQGVFVQANDSTACILQNCIIAGCTLYAINPSTFSANMIITNNTFYGAENNLAIGAYFSSATPPITFRNNIIYGFATGLSYPSAFIQNFSDNNCWYNNTANINTAANWVFGSNEIFVNPSFTNVSQVNGTTATSSSTTLTDSGKNFTTSGVVAGRDYLHVISGTGATAGIYGITAVGTTTVTTDNTIGTSSGGNLVYTIRTGQNFLPTGAV